MEFEVIMMTMYNESDEFLAKKSLDEANKIIKELIKVQKHSEIQMRKILELYLDAFWFFKDIRIKLSKTMHDISKDLCEIYSCKYKFDKVKNKYYSDCPNMVLHCDLGYSFRGTEKYKCSICGKPIIDCEHITGEIYNNIECKKIDDICNICGEEQCKHIVGEKYDEVQAVKIVYDVELVTFDVVEEPEMAFARVKKIYFERDYIEKELQKDRETFKYGKSDLYCHHCLQCSEYNPNQYSNLFDRKQ
ncbi:MULTISPECIES: hypothetical protein [unclassified Clostridium]|uniref:hypothetical protein n=1 Tax=unclassified Clostridium TaxID=2614128 RepID=UPI0020795984|nr:MULTISPECIES: hypothetical protein [unclassified Clostridium]